MGFKSNQSEAFQNGLKPEGDYECIITAIEEHTTKKGSVGLNFTLVIRNDVQGQKYGNSCLFHTIWKKHEPNENDMQVEGYNFAQLMAMGKAAKLPDGKEYDSLKAYCTDLLNKCIRVDLTHEEWNGKERERIILSILQSILNASISLNPLHRRRTALRLSRRVLQRLRQIRRLTAP